MRRAALCVLFTLSLSLVAARAAAPFWVWPTPNPAFMAGKPIADYLQQAGSGDPASGGFGCVRDDQRRFHEGIDIQPVRRDRRGEPVDQVYAFADGVVRYINRIAGDSSYGCYIVLEHPQLQPAIYTLYAHLARFDPGLHVGQQVRRGEPMATMGHTSGGYTIPVARSHLHFEMGVLMTTRFQAWYDWKRFGSKNPHGIYNGYNLMGFDPLTFMRASRDHNVADLNQFFAGMRPAVVLRIATLREPDFPRRYPSLVTTHEPMLVAGWEVACDWTGLPFRWTPLSAGQLAGMRPNEVRIQWVDEAAAKGHPCKQLVRRRGGSWVPGRDLQEVLQLLFGLR